MITARALRPGEPRNGRLRIEAPSDTILRVRYAEGEYNHPCDEDVRLGLSPGVNHWRNWLPPVRSKPRFTMPTARRCVR